MRQVTVILAAGIMLGLLTARADINFSPFAPPVKPALAGPQALAAAKLDPADGNGLRAYLKSRTVSRQDQGRIAAVIARLGSDDFAARLAAEREAEAFGPTAVTALRAAADIEKDTSGEADYEVAYRAGLVLKRLEAVPHAAVAQAAIEALGRSPHPDTATVLYNYLPSADSANVAAAIHESLRQLAIRDGKAEPSVVAGLTHPAPVSRAAATRALVGEPGQVAVRVPTALPAVRAAADREADAGAAFEMRYALATVAEEPAAVGALIASIADLPRGRLWRVEDYLQQLAGTAAPKAYFGKSPATRVAAQKLWAGWWAKAGGSTDWAKFQYTPRTTGRLLSITLGNSQGSVGQVTSLSDDFQPEWAFSVPGGIYDALVRPDGVVVTAEQGLNELRFRANTGAVLGRVELLNKGQPMHSQPTQIAWGPGESYTVVCRNVVLRVPGPPADPKTTTALYERLQPYDIVTACWLPDGRTVAILQNPPQWMVVIAPDGAVTEPVKAPQLQLSSSHISVSGPGRVMVSNTKGVIEYDLASGKAVWTFAVPAAKFSQRIANGNMLVVAGERGQERVIEVSPDGESLWELKSPVDPFYKVYQR